MKKLLFLTLVLLSTAHASPLHKVLKFANSPLERIECELEEGSVVENSFKLSSGNYLGCHHVSSFDRVLQKVKSIQPSAPDISLYIMNSYPNASFDMGRIIRIPLTLTFSGKWGAVYNGNYNSTDTVLAHEYGHAIFSQKMKEYDFYKSFQADSYKSSTLELAIQKAYEKRNPGNIVKFYTQQLDALNEKRINDELSKKIRKVMGPYNELFADLVAAFTQSRKSAMVNALYYDEMSDSSFEIIQSRDFGENSLSMDGSYLQEEHGMLAPARRFIGNNLWAESQKEKTEVLDLLFAAIAQETQEILKYDVDHLDPTELNDSLIGLLKEKIEDKE